jgi:hypothetical protein
MSQAHIVHRLLFTTLRVTILGICSQICAKYTGASDPLEGSETEKCCCFVYNFYTQI